GMASVFVGDMRSARFKEPFDAAFNSINSIGYLVSNEEIVSHLRVIADSMKPGGIYIVHLGCATESSDVGEPQLWTHERDGVQVTITWGGEGKDWKKKLSHQFCRMEINDCGKKLEFHDPHTMRLWLFEDWLSCIKCSERFVLEAVYNEEYEKISQGTPITGSLGNLYYVLKSA
ncbi:MAG: hypothetical protein QGH40_04735, partial [bacterium]|nr:hypothetical protein [bacterium]